MKMSKKLLALVLSLGCIGALTACDMGVGSSNESVGGLSTESVESVESVETPETPDDGRLELPVVKGEEITKEQWDSAFDLLINPKNVTALVYGEQFRGGSPIIGNRDTWITRTTTLKYDNGRVLQVEESREEDTVDHREWYFEQIDDTGVLDDDYFGVQRYSADGEWVTTYPHKEMMTSPLDPRYKEVFDQLTFESETGSYVGTDVLVGNESRYFRGAVRMTFVDGKLYLLEWTKAEVDAGDLIWDGMKMIFSEYATTSVSRPEGVEVPVKPDDGGETPDDTAKGMSREEWERGIFVVSAHENGTIEMGATSRASGEREEYLQKKANELTEVTYTVTKDGVSSSETKYFSAVKGEIPCVYVVEDGAWKKYESSQLSYEELSWFSKANLVTYFASMYEQFTYDAENDVYYGASVELLYLTPEPSMKTMMLSDVRISFVNGVVSEITFDSEYEEDAYICFSNVGTTTVELPTVGEEVTPAVDWEGIFATMCGYQNYTIAINNLVTYADGSVEDMRMMMESDVASSRIMQEVNDVWRDETYYSVEDGVEYVYYQTENVWEKIVYPYEDEFPVGSVLMGELMPMMQGLSAHVTYDANEGVYIGGNFTIEFGGIEIKVREARMQVENGTVVWFEFISNITGEEAAAGNMRYSVTIGNINTTVVELPEIEDEPVEEEAWQAIFDKMYTFDNLTLVIDNENVFFDKEGTQISTTTYKTTANALSLTVDSTNGTQREYYERIDGVDYYYTQQDGKWVREVYPYGSLPIGTGLMQNLMIFVVDACKQTTYNEAEEIYTAENIVVYRDDMAMTIYTIRVKVVDGALVWVESESDIVSSRDGVIGRSTSRMVWSDIGTTVVELPALEEDEPETDGNLTAEEWQTITANTKASDKFAATIQKVHEFYNGEATQTEEYVYQVDGDKIWIKQTVNGVSGSNHFEKLGNQSYAYINHGEYYTKQLYVYSVAYGADMMLGLVGDAFDQVYAYLTYNAEEDAYCGQNVPFLNNGEAMVLRDVRIKVADGKIVLYEATTDIFDENGEVIGLSSASTVFENYGTMVVTLPETVTFYTVDALAWDCGLYGAMVMNNFTGSMIYTYEYSDGSPSKYYESYILMQENATYQYGVQNGREYQQYYAKVDGVDYAYTLSDGVWTRNEFGAQLNYNNTNMASVMNPLRSLYASFVFDEEKGAYTCSEITLDLGNGSYETIYNVELIFKDGVLTTLYYELALRNGDGVQNGVAKVTLSFWAMGETAFTLPEVNA